MTAIKVGDRVRIKDRAEWPTPPGYQLANSEGTVIEVREELGFVIVRLEKTISTSISVGNALTFREEALEKT